MHEGLSQTPPADRMCPVCGLGFDKATTNCPYDGSPLVVYGTTAQASSVRTTTVKDTFQNDPHFLGKYEFIGQIGSGGMGVIYKARQIILDKYVAIKMVHAHLVSQESFKRFQLEGKAAGLLSHPYIITVHDLGMTEQGAPYMIMDYVDGVTLADLLAEEGTLTTRRFLDLFIQVCDALAHAHHRNVLHRDIKPSNIMVVKLPSGQEEIRVMDFGIAKLLTDADNSYMHLTKTGEAVGSPIYMSPEQARGTKIDTRTDLYSLGCVMYEALSGTPPFLGKTQLDTMLMHLNDKPKNVSDTIPPGKRADMNPQLNQIIMKLLDKNPMNRFATMDDLKEALIAVRGGTQPKLPKLTTSSVKLPAMPAKTSLIALIALAVILPAIAVGAWFFTSSHSESKSVTPSTVNTATTTSTSTSSGSTTTTTPTSTTTESTSTSTSTADSASKPSLDDLYFAAGNPGNAEQLKTLPAATMKQLDLHDADFDDAAIAPLSNLTNTEFLILDGTKVQNLEALRPLQNLKILSLRKCQLTPQAMEVIGSLKNLVVLGLQNVPIGDADLDKLHDLKHLRAVELYGTNTTKKGIVDLKKSLPDCGALDIEVRTPNAMDLVVGLAHLMKDAGEGKPHAWEKAHSELKSAIALLKSQPEPSNSEAALNILQKVYAETNAALKISE